MIRRIFVLLPFVVACASTPDPLPDSPLLGSSFDDEPYELHSLEGLFERPTE